MEFIFHYLDDLLVMGPPGSGVCKHNLELLVAECHELGVDLAAVKLEEPGSVITFLGIKIDTRAAILPAGKLQNLLQATTYGLAQKSCTHEKLESLIGTCQYACKVILPGWSFLRRVIMLLRLVSQSHHHI